jgi:cation:H+ antiporter
MYNELILFILGIIGLWIGAGITITGAEGIAKQFKISYLFVGLTILSIGTSLPEIFTHIMSSVKTVQGIEATGIAVGTNIGSNIIQITLIMGIIGMLTTIKSSKEIQNRDGIIMLAAIAGLWLLGLNGTISRIEGIILAVLYLVYLYWISRDEKSIKALIDPHHKPMNGKKEHHILHNISLLAIGLIILGLGSTWVINNTLFFADLLNLQQTFFGLMIIGVSTALPELTTALRGVMKGAKNMSLGVLIGSNITNPMLALGIGAAITAQTIDKTLIYFDIPFWFIISAIALLVFRNNNRLDRHEAVILIAAYIGYVAYKFYSII